MIQATFRKENGSFVEYELTGHANFAEIGKDIVCAGVSTLFITITNQLLFKPYVKIRDQKVTILNPNEIDNALVEALLCGLYDIQQNYPEHVFVRVVEVENMVDASKITVGTINLRDATVGESNVQDILKGQRPPYCGWV